MTANHSNINRALNAAIHCAVALTGGLAPAKADNLNFHWKQGAVGNYDDPAMWGENKSPGENDNAYFPRQGGQVTLNVNAKVRNIELSSPGEPRVRFLISPEKTLDVMTAGTIKVGELQMDQGKWKGPLDNTAQGRITILPTDPAVFSTIDSSAFTQSGALNLRGATNKRASLWVRQDLDNQRGGTITLGTRVSPQDEGTSGDAWLDMDIDWLVPAFKTLKNLPGATMNFNKDRGGKREFSGNLDNQGTINIGTNTDFNSTRAGVKGSFLNTGVINISDGNATLVMKGKEFRNFQGNTRGNVNGPGTIDVTGLDDRKFSNIKGNITARRRGFLPLPEEFGVSAAMPDLTTVVGDYEQLQEGELSIEIDASSSLVQHGQLRVMADSALGVGGMAYLGADSLVNVSLINSGEFLQVGQEFPILVADALTLDGGTCPTLAAASTYGVQWSVNCNTPNSVMLRVEAVPEPATIGFTLMGMLSFVVRRVRRPAI